MAPRDPSDALVFFGASGDLAHKKIFPALYAMAKHGRPRRAGHRRRVVAVDGRGSRAPRARQHRPSTAAASTTKARSSSSPSSLRYVDGDYNDPATFTELKENLERLSTHPAHYLAIPPSMFATVVEGLGSSGCGRRTRA